MKRSRVTVKTFSARYRAVYLWLNALSFILCVPVAQGVSFNSFDDFYLFEGKEVVSGYKTYNKATVTGGVLQFSGSGFISARDVVTLSGGKIYSENATGGIYSNMSINISGGSLEAVRMGAPSISISGGSFTDSLDLWSSDLTISGGDFNVKRLFIEAGNITIDSDAVATLGNFEEAPGFVFIDYSEPLEAEPRKVASGKRDTSKISVSGSQGLSVFNTSMQSVGFTGKFIGNKDSFIGNFNNRFEKWVLDTGAIYSNNDFRSSSFNVFFDRVDLELNDNAVAGVGNIIQENAFGKTRLKLFDGVLTKDEINTSIRLILAEVLAVEEKSKNIDDFSEALKNFDHGSLQSVVSFLWRDGGSIEEPEKREYLESYLLDRIGNQQLDSVMDVTISDSTVTLNDTSSLVNYPSARQEIMLAAMRSIPLKSASGDIIVDHSTVRSAGINMILAKEGGISFSNESRLIVDRGASLDIGSKNGNTVLFDDTSLLELSGTMNGNVNGGSVSFNSSTAKLNGVLSGSGVNLTFKENYNFGNITNKATLNKVTVADGKVLDIGETALKAQRIEGGTLKAVLTDAAKETPIVTASAKDVVLDLDMSAVSKKEVTEYKITDGSGFTFGKYNARRYAVSETPFDMVGALSVGVLDAGWEGGNLYILRLRSIGEMVIDELKENGFSVSSNEQNGIMAIDDDVFDVLASSHQKKVDYLNNLLLTTLDNRDHDQMKQLVGEIAPKVSTVSQTALVNAGSVLSVVSTRMSGGISVSAVAGRGRSGGDYTAGATSVWAKGMYNKAKFDVKNGFSSSAAGFAVGVEHNIDDSFKAGVGYAYTTSDISTGRSKTEVNTHTGFVYGEYKPDDFYINGILSYGYSKYNEMTRLAKLENDFNAGTAAAQVFAGYVFGVVTPEAGIRYTNVLQKAYTNTLGVKMEAQTLETLTGIVGMKVSKKFRFGRSVITPEAKLSLTHDFQRENQSRTVKLADGSSYVTTGESMKRFGVEIGGGISLKAGNFMDIGLSYEGKFKKDYTDHTGLVNIKYNF